MTFCKRFQLHNIFRPVQVNMIYRHVKKYFHFFSVGKFVAWITDLATCNKRKGEMDVAIKDLRAQHGKMISENKKLKEAQATAQKVSYF